MAEDTSLLSTEDLVDRIKDRTSEMSHGSIGMTALGELLSDIRELEERVIVSRHKGLELLKKEDHVVASIVESASSSEPTEPELLTLSQDQVKIPDTSVVQEPMIPLEQPMEATDEPVGNKQISLIDSIEELKGVGAETSDSVDEGIQDGVRPKKVEASQLTYAERMEKRPVQSVKKELNLNQRLGLARVVAPGDDEALNKLFLDLDTSVDLDSAIETLRNSGGERWVNAEELLEQMIGILERKFQ